MRRGLIRFQGGGEDSPQSPYVQKKPAKVQSPFLTITTSDKRNVLMKAVFGCPSKFSLLETVESVFGALLCVGDRRPKNVPKTAVTGTQVH